MALARNYRFPVSFGDVFPSGALAIGEVEPATERQSEQDRARGRAARQRRDEATGLPIWMVMVSDPAPARRSEASPTVQVLSEDEPVLPDPIAGLGVRPVEFVGLTAEPRVGGQGEFRYLTFQLRADGVRPASSGGGSSAGSGSSGKGARGGSSAAPSSGEGSGSSGSGDR